MATKTIDEFVTKINQLPKADRDELLRRLNESPQKNAESLAIKANGKKRHVDPNITWIKENKHKYAGNYVALQDGKLIAYARTIKETDQTAKAKGVDRPLLHYILAEGEEAFYAGW